MPTGAAPVTPPDLAVQVAGWAPPPVEAEERLDAGAAARLADLLGVDAGGRVAEGLPVLWHWAFFLDWPALVALGPDGHPLTGGFQPPLVDRRRMFAGGRCTVEAPLQVGVGAVVRRSLLRAEVKHGSTGALLLVTVGSELSQGARTCVREEQDFVYRSGPSARRGDDAEAAARPASGIGSRVSAGDAFCADPLLLFRFSALTANSHRIHYDHPYATGVEGYPGLVVHGPLLALLMAERAHTSTGRAVRAIDFRFHRPAFAGQALQVTAEADGPGVRLAVLGPDGDVRATGTAQCTGDGA